MKTPKLALVAFATILVSSASLTTPASAHSWKDCAWDVIQFCGSDQACRQAGFAGCNHHQHPGNPPPEAPDPNMTADPGRQLNKSGPAFKAQ